MAGDRLRNILRLMTRNRFLGVLTGFLVTALIQSSSATTVTLVSFVHAGVLSIVEATGVIMGANIGTTVTGWIVALSLQSFKVIVANISLPLIGLFFPLMFIRKENYKNFAEFIIGFALLLLGIFFLKETLPEIKSTNPETLNFLRNIIGSGPQNIFLFVGIGTAITVLVQSSSAAMAITLVLLSQGWIDLESGAAMILGENIGTTITAQFAALVANVNARRTAMIHTVFNLIGVFWMVLVMNPFLDLIDSFLGFIPGVSEMQSTVQDQEIQAYWPLTLAMFHTLFNISNTILLIGFVPLLERLVVKIIPTKKIKPNETLRYLHSGILNTPELAIVEAKKEIIRFAEITQRMYNFNKMLLLRKSERFQKILFKIQEMEDICDQLEVEVADFLSQISESNLTQSTSRKIRGMWNMLNDLERIGDLNMQIAQANQRKSALRMEFSPDSIEEFSEMVDLLDDYFRLTLILLKDDKKETEDPLQEIRNLENRVNLQRNRLRDQEYLKIENGTTSAQAGLLFIDIVSACEKIGDHLMNVHEANYGLK